jgi:hypothetical protein
MQCCKTNVAVLLWGSKLSHTQTKNTVNFTKKREQSNMPKTKTLEEQSVYDWIASQYEISRDTLEQDCFLQFMILYPLFEKKYLRTSSIITYANSIKDIIKNINDFSPLDDAARFFHKRYNNNKEKCRELLYGARAYRDIRAFNNIKDAVYDNTDSTQRLQFLLYVIRCWRNNLFHDGNRLADWDEYEEGFRYCVSSLVHIIKQLQASPQRDRR